MINLILLIIVMVLCAYFRFKFDKEYAMPVIAGNNDLSFLYKWGLIIFSIAMVCFVLNLPKIAFGILIFLIPFVLYLNFKTYWIAIKNKRKNLNKF